MLKRWLGTFLLLILLLGCTPNEHEATFVRTVDGDTLIAAIDGKDEYIRLLLVDTPETKHPDKEIQPFGPEASEFINKSFSPSDPIQIEYGTEKRDKYDRLIAYVYTEDGQMINELLLEKGLARVAYVYPPNDKYVEEFRELESEAKNKEIGIWSIDGYVTADGFNAESIPVIPEKSEKKPNDNITDPDRDCGDFSSQEEAQTFFESAGGPGKDSHRLDGEGDGLVCEGL
ncbi:thermonuclease family protein [Virgibacillus necropolis]|uniref:thermonuclease family protein n=1 Tax=Virgibacillus necropolis TaxID=163877 RepID=UPI001D03DC63|nr:thermonuclease family protein [Virgibacillus necropolis]